MTLHLPTGRAYPGSALLAAVLASGMVGGVAKAADAPRERVSLSAGWRFTQGDPDDAGDSLRYAKLKPYLLPTGNDLVLPGTAERASRPAGDPGEKVSYVRPTFDDRGWRRLDLPHDWGIERPFKQEYDSDTGKLPWWGVGWYRKHFTVPAGDEGRCFFLDIDGAMSYSAVWLNGHFIGGWPYGYTSYRLDLTPHVRPGADNLLAVRLDNPPRSSRWYPGGGIYRNVWLVKTAAVHVGQWGTFITTPHVTADEATVEIHTTLENATARDAHVTLTTSVQPPAGDGRQITAEPARLRIPAHLPVMSRQTLRVPRPQPWDLAHPHLYTAVTTVERAGRVVDRLETVFGIRSIRFDPDRGFLLNGKLVRLQGVCDHHDLGPLGTAVNRRALQRQLEILKEMGCNAIRTSHNPPAPELLDLCDRMGLVVMDEAFDCWRRGKTPNDYHLLFADWHEKDLRALVRRDRNHPCVVLWSIGNEVPDQASRDGPKLAAELAGMVHEEDRSRPVTAACDNVRSGYNGFQKALDVFGYNYKPAEYGKFHRANPTIPVFGSETASCVSSRGEYFFPVKGDKLAGRADFQVSSYDLYAPPWAWPPDVEFRGLDRYRFAAGEFVWTGFDYLGEPTPYGGDSRQMLTFTDQAVRRRMADELKRRGKILVPSRSSYFGIVDLCGLPKDRFYIYQARWRPELPMAHILPHWNWPERAGQVTPVHVYTSGDEAELFLNGKSQGRKARGKYEYRLRWDEVIYEPGELKVVAYKGGKRWAEDVVRTTGPAARLVLRADRTRLRADGMDLAFVTAAVADADGRTVPRSRNRIRFTVEGPAEIVAVDNGDATDHESFRAPDRRAFNGLCVVVVRTKAGAAGEITLRARADGLRAAETRLRSEPGR
jgi:beta-galactosidase